MCKMTTLKKTKNGFQDQISLNAGQKYCRKLQEKHSAILLTFIKLPFVIKIYVLSIFERLFYTGFTVPWINPWYTSDSQINTLADSGDQDETSHNVTFYHGLHCLLRQKLSSERSIFYLKLPNPYMGPLYSPCKEVKITSLWLSFWSAQYDPWRES